MQIGQLLAKYWLEFVLGLIATFILAKINSIKTWWKQIQDDKEAKKKKERMEEVKECVDELRPLLEEIRSQSKEGDDSLHAEINTLASEVQILKSGVLAIQGDNFKEKCHRAMEDMDGGMFIDSKKYEALRHDHNAYNALGGNSDGDELWQVFTHRYENQ